MYPQLLEPSILPTYKAAPRDPSSSSHSPRQLAAAAAAMFGVVFPDHSFPLDATAFAQVAPNSWALDLSTLSLAAAPRSAVVFLLPAAAAALPPGKAVAVYFQPAANRPFAFLGALGPGRPSASLPLPEAGDEPEPPLGPAKLGVAVEDAAALPPPPDGQRAERVALRVGENLFNFMQSFCGADGGKLVVPTDILDRWFRKFQERAKKDPSYLKTFDF